MSYSVKNTKEVLVFAFKIGDSVKKSNADGKFDFNDISNFLQVIPTIAPAFTNIADVPKELGDLTNEESEELQKLILEEVGEIIDAPKLLEQINAGLKFIKAGYDFYITLK